MGKIVRASDLDGISIEVISEDESFDVIIVIQEGAELTTKRKSKEWSIQFKGFTSKRITKTRIQIRFEKQSYNRRNLEETFERAFILDNKLEGRIYVSPEFYLSEELLARYLCIMEKRKAKIFEKFLKTEAENKGKSQKRKQGSSAGYLYNNLFRPYQGGSCSSK